MATTYQAIATYEVGAGGASSIDFSSIPADYTDIAFLISSRTTQTNPNGAFFLRLNASTTSYSGREIVGTGSTAESNTRGVISGSMYALNTSGATSTSSTFGSHFIYIPNYAGSNNKSISVDAVSENNATEAYAGLSASLWSNTSAITQVTFYPNSGSNFVQYTTATLYGIKNS